MMYDTVVSQQSVELAIFVIEFSIFLVFMPLEERQLVAKIQLVNPNFKSGYSRPVTASQVRVMKLLQTMLSATVLVS